MFKNRPITTRAHTHTHLDISVTRLEKLYYILFAAAAVPWKVGYKKCSTPQLQQGAQTRTKEAPDSSQKCGWQDLHTRSPHKIHRYRRYILIHPNEWDSLSN